MPVSVETYERVALEDPEGRWELVCGRLRSKPGMSMPHARLLRELNLQITPQLVHTEFVLGLNLPLLRVSTGSYHVPDLCIMPRSLEALFADRLERLEVYDDAMPLVAEVWSPSTGDYDVDVKLAEYQRRADREIWRLHPREQTLKAWRLQPNGLYSETFWSSGSVRLHALPDVVVDLDALFR